MSKVILLVEDNPTDEKLTLLAFRECGVESEVIVERDGAAALDYLFTTGKYAGHDPSAPPALMLLDLNLPKVDGLEVLRRVRDDARTTTLPVIVFTSSREAEDVLRSYALRANAYVRKPVEYDDLVEAARSLGFFWLVMNEPEPNRRVAP
jgi:two-component system response regulator